MRLELVLSRLAGEDDDDRVPFAVQNTVIDPLSNDLLILPQLDPSAVLGEQDWIQQEILDRGDKFWQDLCVTCQVFRCQVRGSMFHVLRSKYVVPGVECFRVR